MGAGGVVTGGVVTGGVVTGGVVVGGVVTGGVVVGGVVVVGGAVAVEPDQTCSSAKPTLPVLALTPVTVNRRLVVDRLANVTVTPAPALFNAGTATVDPSENVNVPAAT